MSTGYEGKRGNVVPLHFLHNYVDIILLQEESEKIKHGCVFKRLHIFCIIFEEQIAAHKGTKGSAMGGKIVSCAFIITYFNIVI